MSFEKPPLPPCPRCMTSNWVEREHHLWDPGDEARGFPRELMGTRTSLICATCHPDPRSKRRYINGQDPDRGRGPFNL